MNVYELGTVWDSPELIQSLSGYATAIDSTARKETGNLHDKDEAEKLTSVMLLKVQAVADYYTDDKELMKTPPPVLVEIILDPFFYNFMNSSLVPAVAYLTFVGVVTWFLARWITFQLQLIAQSDESPVIKKD